MKDLYNKLIDGYFGESRALFIEKTFNHLLSLNRPIKILETGCQHTDGFGFTSLFGDLIKNYTGGELLSIDLDLNHIQKSKEINKDYLNVIDFVCGDSVQVIKSLSNEFINSVDLFILDSYDLNICYPIPSFTHHLKELLSFIDRVNKNTWIAIDDNYMPDTWIEWITEGGAKKEIIQTGDKIIGKGTYCDVFLKDNAWTRDEEVIISGDRNIFLYYKT